MNTVISPTLSTVINAVLAAAGAGAGVIAGASNTFGGQSSTVLVAGVVVAIVSALNSALHGYSTPIPGPLVTPPAPPAT